jgi:hypothetical protein
LVSSGVRAVARPEFGPPLVGPLNLALGLGLGVGLGGERPIAVGKGLSLGLAGFRRRDPAGLIRHPNELETSLQSTRAVPMIVRDTMRLEPDSGRPPDDQARRRTSFTTRCRRENGRPIRSHIGMASAVQ